MADITPEQVRKNLCPYDKAYCPEFQKELDARRAHVERLGIRYNPNMFVNPGKGFFKDCPKIDTYEEDCMRYKVWLYNRQHVRQ